MQTIQIEPNFEENKVKDILRGHFYTVDKGLALFLVAANHKLVDTCNDYHEKVFIIERSNTTNIWIDSYLDNDWDKVTPSDQEKARLEFANRFNDEF